MKHTSKILIAAGLLVGMSLSVAAIKWLPDLVAVEKVKREVASRMKDPESARFLDVVWFKSTGAACGNLNAKNSMGGYTGFKGFVLLNDGSLHIQPEDENRETASYEVRIASLREQITYYGFEASCHP